MRAATFSFVLPVLLACSNTSPSHAPAQPSPVVEEPLDTAAAYRIAIADYIAAMDTSDAPLPDTVFIGRHPVFPHIAMPLIIAHRTVLIIDPSEGPKEQHRPRFTYLNIIGTVTPRRAQFYFIRFGKNLAHRPDGAEDRHLYYRVESEGLVLERVSN